MTWVEKKAEMVSLLTARSYTENVDNLNYDEVSQSFGNMAYTLKPSTDIDTVATSSRSVTTIFAELNINYTVETNSEYDIAFDAFLSIITELLDVVVRVSRQPTLTNDIDSNSRAFTGKVVFEAFTQMTC